jgi:hypothetical protein
MEIVFISQEDLLAGPWADAIEGSRRAAGAAGASRRQRRRSRCTGKSSG